MQSLQPFHTFNIPANAREIIEATSIEQIQQAWQNAQAENLPVLFLGQGSNMLFLEDFQGMVIVNRCGFNNFTRICWNIEGVKRL